MKKIEQDKVIDYVFSLLNEKTYLVGGYLRDALLNKKSNDLDFVTSLKPEVLKNILPYEISFIKTGNFSFKIDDYKITVTTMRKEGDYKDFRHPSYIEFISDYKEDFKRRDFTINALYMDKNYNLLDNLTCIDDILNKKLKMIGDPDIRLKEDPLRIIRAYRFIYELNLIVDDKLNKSLIRNKKYISHLKREKVIEEIKKSSYQKKIIEALKGEDYGFEL